MMQRNANETEKDIKKENKKENEIETGKDTKTETEKENVRLPTLHRRVGRRTVGWMFAPVFSCC